MLGALALTGCVGMEDTAKTAQVSSPLFEAPPTTVAKSQAPAADPSVSLRVDVVGRKVLAANPQIGMSPMFGTIQSPTPEIFHVDQKVVYVTDGLVKQLPSEGDLAAALSYELARMVAEREARVKQDIKYNTPRPPIDLPIGGPSPSAADMASTAEMAKYDRKRREVAQAPAKLNPETLARGYLEKAGFMRTDFDRALPSLQAADKNSTWERQMKGVAAPNAWTK
jgi:predicted Zn-dependent protease